MNRCERSGGYERVFEMSLTHSHIQQTAHTDSCKIHHIAYTNFSLRMNSGCSKHVGDIRN